MSLELQALLVSGVGSVHVITGPMFAGKSRELLELLRRAGRAEITRCLVRSPVDTRDAERARDAKARTGAEVVLQTHAGEQLNAEKGLTVIRAATLAEALPQVPRGCKIAAIDEGQFFPDLSAGCDAFARKGMLVYVAALNGDKHQAPWPNVSVLLANCETNTKLSGWCQRCRARPAHFTRARSAPRPPGTPRSPVGEFEPGGDEMYEAVCRGCLAC